MWSISGRAEDVVRAQHDIDVPPSLADPSTHLPTTVGWLASLIFAGALGALSISLLPYWPIEHADVDWAIGWVMMPVGAVMWLLRARAAEWVIHVGLVVGICCITASVWAAGPTPESQAAALFYGFLSAFASAFLQRRLALTYLAFAGALYLGVLLMNWRAAMATQWAVNMFAIIVPCVVISTLVKQLRGLALHDALTGLANRRLLNEIMPASFSMSRRDDRPLSVVAIDLDGLKLVNDRFGHAAGDQLLRAATSSWTAALRTGDFLARVGGDEFVLVLPDADERGAEATVQRLRESAPQVAFSAGVVRWTGESLEELLQSADAGLYAAKNTGRGRTVSKYAA
jgi:diguanylate cyclase (GGDEF)-like protein